MGRNQGSKKTHRVDFQASVVLSLHLIPCRMSREFISYNMQITPDHSDVGNLSEAQCHLCRGPMLSVYRLYLSVMGLFICVLTCSRDHYHCSI